MAAAMLVPVPLCVVVSVLAAAAALGGGGGAPLAAAAAVDAVVADFIDIGCTKSRGVPNIECGLLLYGAGRALVASPAPSASDLLANARASRTAACALRLSNEGAKAMGRHTACTAAGLAKSALSSLCKEAARRGDKPPPLAVACALRNEDGYGATGHISDAIHQVPLNISRLAGACELKSKAVFGAFLGRIKADISPRECSALAANCAKLAALLGEPDPSELSTAVTANVLAAAIRGLQNGTVPAEEPVALATACAMAKSGYLLHDACSRLDNSTISRCGYEDFCLDLFKKGTKWLPSSHDVFNDPTYDPFTRRLRKTKSTVVKYKDCCELVSRDECLCRMKKAVIEAGTKPIECLNKKELQDCK